LINIFIGIVVGLTLIGGAWIGVRLRRNTKGDRINRSPSDGGTLKTGKEAPSKGNLSKEAEAKRDDLREIELGNVYGDDGEHFTYTNPLSSKYNAREIREASIVDAGLGEEVVSKHEKYKRRAEEKEEN